MKTCIINVAIEKWYPSGQDRLAEALKTVRYIGNVLFYKNVYPKNSPTHEQVPYAFKSYAIEEARRIGYDLILYLDSSIWPIKPIDRIWKEIGRYSRKRPNFI